VNSLVGRIFWDFLREKYWSDQVAHKIQKKLGKIKVRVAKLVYGFGVSESDNQSIEKLFSRISRKLLKMMVVGKMRTDHQWECQACDNNQRHGSLYDLAAQNKEGCLNILFL